MVRYRASLRKKARLQMTNDHLHVDLIVTRQLLIQLYQYNILWQPRYNDTIKHLNTSNFPKYFIEGNRLLSATATHSTHC